MNLSSARRRIGRAVPSGRARFVPVAVLVPISLAMLFSPGSTVPSGPENSDKVIHCLLFAALALATSIAGTRPVVAAPTLLVYAAASEILQETLPIHRSGDVRDFAADAVGVAAGLAIALAAGIRTGPRTRRYDAHRHRGVPRSGGE